MGLAKFKAKAWAWPLVIGLILWFCGPIRPAGVSMAAWHMFAIFVATIVGCITQPLPIAGTTLVGFTVMVLVGLAPMKEALTAFSNSSAWLIAMAFMLSRGFIKTGLGRRIALVFVRSFGHRSLGLPYSIMGIDLVTSPAIPSNTARAGGVVYPIVKSLAETYGSDPKKGTRKKIGSFLVFSEFHSNLVTSATFMTAMAPNLVIVALAKTLHINITWLGWFVAGVVPSIICLIATPYIIYKMYPPEVKETPNAKEWANKELKEMGAMKLSEKLMAAIFILTLILWMLTSFIPAIDATFVAFLAIALLLITGVLETKDILKETGAWNVLIWLSILVYMADQLAELGFIKWFSNSIGSALQRYQLGMGIGSTDDCLLLRSLLLCQCNGPRYCNVRGLRISCDCRGCTSNADCHAVGLHICIHEFNHSLCQRSSLRPFVLWLRYPVRMVEDELRNGDFLPLGIRNHWFPLDEDYRPLVI